MADLKWAEKFARLLDSKFKVPGTKFTFGIDPIIGLVPGLGDGISMAFQLLLVASLLRHGGSGKLKALLFINVMLDTLIGSIPVLGGIFDFFFKANQRNLRLMQEHIHEGKHQGSGRAIWLALVALVVFTIGLLIYVTSVLVKWVIEVLQG